MKRGWLRVLYIVLVAVVVILIGEGLVLLKRTSQQAVKAGPPLKGGLNSTAAQKLTDQIPRQLQSLPYLIYPTSLDYNTARFNFNHRFSVFPHAIITPRTTHEAGYALQLIKKYDLPFSVRSGGHCYEPGSLSSWYIFDLRYFNEINPDVEHKEVYLGAGCRTGDVIEALGKLGYAIPTGTCSRVGIGGFALGGGIGMLTSIYGLAADAIKSFLFLNENCEVDTIDATTNPDLFWALCGSGNGSFGIVLGMTFEMYPIPAASYYELSWEWDAETVPQIVQAWQTWIQSLPDNISSQLRMRYSSDKSEIGISGLKIGNEPFTEWETVFKALNPAFKTFTGSYGKLAPHWEENPQGSFCKMKSKMLMQPLSNDAIAKTVDLFAKLQQERPLLHLIFDFAALGPKVALTKSSFFPKQALACWFQGFYWDHPDMTEPCLAYSRQFYTDISPYVSKYSYANAVDYDLGDDYLDSYYGDNINSLIDIKNKYDVNNLFQWQQSIPLSR